jgi:hypothetical protein
MIARPSVRARARQMRDRTMAARDAERAIADMRAGGKLWLQYSKGRPLWTLWTRTDAYDISAEAAALVVASPGIRELDAGLFKDCMPGQSWEACP